MVLQVVRPAAGGIKGHVLQLACGMRDHGFGCEIACPGDSELVHDALEANVKVHPVPIGGPIRPLRDLLAVIALCEVIRERRPAIVHAHGSKAGLIARIAVAFAGRPPAVVTVHNDVLYAGISPLMRRVYIAAERRLARSTARVITVSEALRREMVDTIGLDPRLVATVYNGLDLAPFVSGGDRAATRERHGIPTDALAFGLAARFAPQKALDILVDAAPPVLDAHPRSVLVIAGSGPLLEAVKTKARALAVRDRILFPGLETDMPGLLSALDIYVSSSMTEGLALGTIEAMAAGLPVVSTDVGGIPEVVEDGVTGVLVRAGKSAPITDAVLKLARDPVLRRKMGDAGRERALERFGEGRMLERTAQVYREVLS